MNCKPLIGMILLACLSFLALPNEVQADMFYQNSGFFPNPPDSGSAFGMASAPNAVATSISSGISHSAKDEGVFLHTVFSISGIWGDPFSSDPWHDVLENHGLHASSSLHLTEVTMDGNMYEFESVISLNLNGSANLVFNENHTVMTGFFFAGSSGQGVVPVQSWSSVQIFEPGLPSGADWQVTLNSKWMVTADYQQIKAVPSPGALALLGIAGLTGYRRRR